MKFTDAHAPQIYRQISDRWENNIIPVLSDYIKIPNKSVQFDSDWKKHGYMDQAMQLIVDWCRAQPINQLKLQLLEEQGRTPLLLIEIPGQSSETVLLYGHMDKQPEMQGWDPDLGPWKPVLKDNKLYGRGGADDGYAVFAALTAIAALQRHDIPHARCVILVEACEESGSADLPYYLTQLQDRIGNPSLVVCLDTGCANYEQMWACTSLRGVIGGTLSIEMLSSGIHSGIGSGVVPSTVMILRQLLDRIEDAKTGQITLNGLTVTIPADRIKQARATAAVVNTSFRNNLPLVATAKTLSADVAELLLNQTWRPQLSVTGLDGLPATADAGNVTVPRLIVKMSLRIPPTCDGQQATQLLKEVLEKNPPFGANINFQSEPFGNGWQAPELSDWLAQANDEASQRFFGKPAAYFGEGGSIPFMNMLGQMYPQTQFLITGVLGPKSNAHGPNEFLHIPMVKKLTGCVASVLAAHYQHFIR